MHERKIGAGSAEGSHAHDEMVIECRRPDKSLALSGEAT
jgi:hypothetical protein